MQYERALSAANDKLTECYYRQNDYAQRLETAKAAQLALKEQVAAAAQEYRTLSASLGENDAKTVAAKAKLDALLQKTFCTDFLTKKIKINEGEVPQYYVENSHPAIVSAELFEMVQEELARRKQMGRQHNGTSCFAGMIFCACCGGMYGSKVWHSNTKYRRVVWQCNGKYKKGEPVCATPNLTDTVIQEKFLEAFNRLLSQRDFIGESNLARQ